MHELAAKNIISSLRKRWQIVSVFLHLSICLAFTALYSSLVCITGNTQVAWSIPLIFIVCWGLLSFNRSTSVTEYEVARFLDASVPELEESSGLLLKNFESMTLLEKLQVEKIAVILHAVKKPSFHKLINRSLLLLLTSLIICLLIVMVPKAFTKNPVAAPFLPGALPRTEIPVSNLLPASLSSVSVRIVPPAYTKKATRVQGEFNLRVEEGAQVHWQVNTIGFASVLKLVFNENDQLLLKPENKKHQLWRANAAIKSSGFYQVKIEETLSRLYRIEVIDDQPPAIRILAPAPYTVINPGEPGKINLQLALSDDYGITSVGLYATIASGSGEAVKFEEQQLSFSGFKRGGRQYRLQRLLNLSDIGMKPGDELYYYVRAIDNHNQESRSDIYIVSLPDTAELLSLEGMASGVNLVPEYFRSQRQIIIETEQLLKDKQIITADQYNTKSNELATDQKLLRLRYGKFLSEETDEEINEQDHETEAHIDASDFGNGGVLADAFTHKHDIAEDAGYFEPGVKAQLKATLAEMWKSELQLRLYKPQQALPFEYKALRLLKDLQQKSRVYVAKTNFKSTPLKLEKRLTGDLSKIVELVDHHNFKQKTGSAPALRKAVSNLELLRSGKELEAGEVEVLKTAGRQLSDMAARQPAMYLDALSALQNILDKLSQPSNISASDISLVENALQQIMPPTPQLPGSSIESPALNLPQQYFKNLRRQ